MNGTHLQAMAGSVPRTLSLDAHPGLCLDAPGNVGASELVQLWECNGHTNQLWLFDSGAWKIQYYADPSKCLDAGDMKEGTQLKLWDCNAQDQQRWGYDYDTRTIYLAGSADASLCMDAYAPLAIGNFVQVWECNGLDQQRFNVFWGTTIRCGSVSLLAAVPQPRQVCLLCWPARAIGGISIPSLFAILR